MCGGWLDQPFVSKYYPGPVLTISIHPTIEFNERSGMATSTRRKAIELWGPRLPADSPEKLAKILFAYDNPPGTEEVSGSQDSIGIAIPGLNKADYAGKYWPEKISSMQDESILQFIEQALYLIPLGPRHSDFHVLHGTRIDVAGAKALADAAEGCWEAILNKDLAGFGGCVRAGYEAQIAMFPNMVSDSMPELIDKYRHLALGLEGIRCRGRRLPDPGFGKSDRACCPGDHPPPQRLRLKNCGKHDGYGKIQACQVLDRFARAICVQI